MRQSKFLSSKNKNATVIFDYHHPKIIKVTFAFSEFLSTHQKSVYSLNSFLRYNQLLEIQPFLTTPNTIHFDQHLISINLYQHTKKQAFSSVSSRDTADLKILQFDWPRRAFWPVSPEPAFSQVWDLCKNTAVNVNFLYRPNLEKN